jgi:hypothetical protein
MAARFVTSAQAPCCAQWCKRPQIGADEQREQRAHARARRAAVAAEEEDRRLAERREQWERDGIYLSRAELEAGEHCRGCGLPILDGLGDWYPLNQLTPEQRAEYEQANAAFRERHRDCRSHRWSLSGHRTEHCGYCCPAPHRH